MSTITAILEADADGTLHLPLPPELRRGKVRVAAKLEAVSVANGALAESERVKRLETVMKRIRARNPFEKLEDPVTWQRETREDFKHITKLEIINPFAHRD